ncbi:MAG: DNA-3-methyladenine glycosylase I [Propionibacteriaceae bacterium]|nr:DNA-3-methyladenine glycosylase I [Propionibacteriaceae bacterium]
MTNISAAELCFGRQAAMDPDYAAYHDTEWGRPVHGEAAVFERICLEGFQVGLSWRTILHKRAAFREDFRDFDPQSVAGFGPDDIARLMADDRIVRNRAKITACVTAAGIVVAMHLAGESLSQVMWSYRPVAHARPTADQWVSLSPQSEALAADLRRRGFRFVGPTNMYAAMQACGVVNDHVQGCPIGDEIDRSSSVAP